MFWKTTGTLLFILFFCNTVNAGILNTWDTESSFLSANSSLSMESFESTSSNNMPLIAGDITVTTDSTIIGFFNGTTSNGVTDGLQAIRYGANDGDSIFFDFSTPVNLFGININLFDLLNSDESPVFTLFDGLGNSEQVLLGPGDGSKFFGFESDLDIVQVQFTMPLANGDGIYFDEAYYGSSFSIVPIPAAVWLFGSGFLALASVARRNNAKRDEI